MLNFLEGGPPDPGYYVLVLAVIVAALIIIGLLVERRGLAQKVIQTEAHALVKLVNAGVTTMKGPVSNEVHFKTGEPPAPGPAIIISVTGVGNKVSAAVQLPGVDKNGQPLESLSKLYLHAMEKSFLGELENLVGLEPHTTVDLTLAQAGQTITVPLTLPKFLTDYYFYAVPE